MIERTPRLCTGCHHDSNSRIADDELNNLIPRITTVKDALYVVLACLSPVKCLFAEYGLLYYDMKGENFLYTCDAPNKITAIISDYGGCGPEQQQSMESVIQYGTYLIPWRYGAHAYDQNTNEPSMPYNTISNTIYQFATLIIEFMNLKTLDGKESLLI